MAQLDSFLPVFPSFLLPLKEQGKHWDKHSCTLESMENLSADISAEFQQPPLDW